MNNNQTYHQKYWKMIKDDPARHNEHKRKCREWIRAKRKNNPDFREKQNLYMRMWRKKQKEKQQKKEEQCFQK